MLTAGRRRVFVSRYFQSTINLFLPHIKHNITLYLVQKSQVFEKEIKIFIPKTLRLIKSIFITSMNTENPNKYVIVVKFIFTAVSNKYKD